jgi:hypothetical protein
VVRDLSASNQKELKVGDRSLTLPDFRRVNGLKSCAELAPAAKRRLSLGSGVPIGDFVCELVRLFR